MTATLNTAEQIAAVSALLREKLGSKGQTLAQSLKRARHRLPRRIYRQARELARAQPMAAHPKLRQTLDGAALGRAASEVTDYLSAIDLADRRKGWVLGMLGGLAFNMILFVALLIGVLMWRGII